MTTGAVTASVSDVVAASVALQYAALEVKAVSLCTGRGVCVALRLHDCWGVSAGTESNSDRRHTVSGDRRRNSRSGRRTSDPHTNWRRIAWLFAAYAVYLSIRSLPTTVKRFFQRSPVSS
jgi:hypothetical protein